MKIATLLVCLFAVFTSYGQDKRSKQILKEGKLLYRLERGSWYVTDDMLARFGSKKDSIGGYLSYETDTKQINTVFFSRFDQDEVLVRYTFDELPQVKAVSIDTTDNAATELERSLIKIRQDARDRAAFNEDGFFSYYENTALNFIPVIQGKRRNVFVLTGPSISGVVLLGNDYKLTYNKRNEFKKKEQIHKSILQFPLKSDESGNRLRQTIHSHIVTDYISSTDICTLLLYKQYVEWTSHTVVSKKKVSIFDLDEETLLVLDRKAWDKIQGGGK